RNGLAHGKPPQFAILNHAAIDSGIPRESATQRLGINHGLASKPVAASAAQAAYLAVVVLPYFLVRYALFVHQEKPKRAARYFSLPMRYQGVTRRKQSHDQLSRTDPPPLKWSDLRYVFDIKEDCNGKEAIQACMKLALISHWAASDNGIVYAACVFC